MLEKYCTVPSTFKKIRRNFLKFSIPPKAKEMHFKTINEIYTSGQLMHLKFNIGLNECTFFK